METCLNFSCNFYVLQDKEPTKNIDTIFFMTENWNPHRYGVIDNFVQIERQTDTQTEIATPC